MDKDRLDQLLRDLDKIHEEKIELLYDLNILEDYKNRLLTPDRLYSIVNLLNWIKSDFEAIRDITRTLAELIQSVHPDHDIKRKRALDSSWMERGQT